MKPKSYRVDEELHAEFAEAAKLDNRPASQVLRELMRGYVNQLRDQVVKTAANESISAVERERRQKAVEFAHASVGLEGFKLSDEEKKHAQRFVNGEIGLQEFIKKDSRGARQIVLDR